MQTKQQMKETTFGIVCFTKIRFDSFKWRNQVYFQDIFLKQWRKKCLKFDQKTKKLKSVYSNYLLKRCNHPGQRWFLKDYSNTLLKALTFYYSNRLWRFFFFFFFQDNDIWRKKTRFRLIPNQLFHFNVFFFFSLDQWIWKWQNS